MIELLRVEFRIIAIERDDDGIVGERALGEGAAYPPALDELPDKVREAVEQANDTGHAA